MEEMVQQQLTHMPCYHDEIEYLLDLVKADLEQKRQVYQRATLAQRRFELGGELQEIEALKERLTTMKELVS